MDMRGVNEEKSIIVDADALAGKVVGRGVPVPEGARRSRHTLSIPD